MGRFLAEVWGAFGGGYGGRAGAKGAQVMVIKPAGG